METNTRMIACARSQFLRKFPYGLMLYQRIRLSYSEPSG